ncbi:hypothetical protein LTR62_006166 [Meristemomyces frigidus]|uniref:Uncharacterized protein n=1 Tax=Meristemomyces frigidus TaxID=1508187 RepID=A0AAN7TD74_9PEZI|nr:hypothetical protein LTR62_006166 [Meristemomyces frigidus]
MPSFADSRREVEKNLASSSQGPDHADILASLQDEIDKHNAVKDDLRKTIRRSNRSRREPEDTDTADRSTKFRFKDGVADPRKRRRRSHRDRSECRHKRCKHAYPSPPSEEAEGSHPFPRETQPATLDEPGPATDDAAFRNSLFDALADDEGAAYWEGVYDQPIHVYDRPSVTTPRGELEEMTDAEYAAYVKTKMWERKHPEVIIERERSAKMRREAEEERAREREAFIRRKEQAAWERAEKRGARRSAGDNKRDTRHKYEFAGEANTHAEHDVLREEYTRAWSHYLTAWDRLKLELLSERTTTPAKEISASKRIPWPVLGSRPVVRANIEDFLRHATPVEGTKLNLLKAERVRWHPDKVQQRFGGKVDEGTMKLVTGVFQIVDALFEEEKGRGG